MRVKSRRANIRSQYCRGRSFRCCFPPWKGTAAENSTDRRHGGQRRDERLRRSRWQMLGDLEADGQIEPLWHVDLLPQVHAAEPRLVNQQQIRAVIPIESENLSNPMPLEKTEPLSVLAAEINDAPRTDVPRTSGPTTAAEARLLSDTPAGIRAPWRTNARVSRRGDSEPQTGTIPFVEKSPRHVGPSGGRQLGVRRSEQQQTQRRPIELP